MKGVLRNIYTGLEAKAATELTADGLADATLAIRFPSDKSLLKSLYRRLSELSATASFTFFFIFSGEDLRTGESVAEAGRFFFLSHYYTPEGNRPLVAFNEMPTKQILELFTRWCSDQALGEPVVQVAKGFPALPHESGPLLYVPTDRQDRYWDTLMSRQQVLKWIVHPAIIEVSDLKGGKELEEKLEALNYFLHTEVPDIHAVLQTIQRLGEERSRDKAALRHLQVEVENLRVFNKELRSSSETMDILNFYHTQYEVLPLWYKRFGHVIKILMGKRKISFFSNKEAQS